MFVKTMLEGTEAVIRSQPKAIENFVVCDLPGFADFADQLPAERRVVGKEGTRWYGGMSYEQSLAAVRSGDLTGVAASDKLLGELEALVPVSKSWRTFNSVIGMCPNVPQYLAGTEQYAAQAAVRDGYSAALDLRRTGRQRRHRRQDVPQTRRRNAGAGSHAREPAAGRIVVRHCHRAAQFPLLSLCVRLDTAPLGPGAQRARVHASKCFSRTRLQVAGS